MEADDDVRLEETAGCSVDDAPVRGTADVNAALVVIPGVKTAGGCSPGCVEADSGAAACADTGVFMLLLTLPAPSVLLASPGAGRLMSPVLLMEAMLQCTI